jgi:hypothetical protein
MNAHARWMLSWYEASEGEHLVRKIRATDVVTDQIRERRVVARDPAESQFHRDQSAHLSRPLHRQPATQTHLDAKARRQKAGNRQPAPLESLPREPGAQRSSQLIDQIAVSHSGSAAWRQSRT